MIGKVYQPPFVSPVSPIVKVEKTEAIDVTDAKTTLPFLTVNIKNTSTDFQTRSREIADSYTRLAHPDGRNKITV